MSARALSPADIEALLADAPISDRMPWAGNDWHAVDAYLRRRCDALVRHARVQARIEWQHYGSGTANFVDAFLYRLDDDFVVARPSGYAHERAGLVLLLSRCAPLFALAEGEQGWDDTRSYRYMPKLAMLDRFTRPAVQTLAADVQAWLEAQALQRITGAALAQPLPRGTKVRTQLSPPPFTHFDALFRWED